MRAAIVAWVLLAACERSPAKSAPVSKTEAKPAARESDRVAAEVRTQMTEFLAYSEGVFKIMREDGKDCELAAKHLGEKAAVFAELGPRMMKLKETMTTLSAADRERIKQESETMMADFQQRYPDAEAIEKRGKECEKSSAAFAEIAPKVMFVKK